MVEYNSDHVRVGTKQGKMVASNEP